MSIEHVSSVNKGAPPVVSMQDIHQPVSLFLTGMCPKRWTLGNFQLGKI